MSSTIVSFEVPQELIATIDQIASNRSVDRAAIFRDALAEYVAEYLDLQADLEEGERQIAAGETVSHEDMLAWLQAQHPEDEKLEANA
jgi:predicted transcriptional regulator